MNIALQKLNQNNVREMQELLAVFSSVFEVENFVAPNDDYIAELLQNDSFIAIVATMDGRVVGGLTIYVLKQYYSEDSLAYLYDLAVLQKFQRQGIGKQIMEFTIRYCKSAGYKELYVQAEKIDEHAIDFYRVTKPSTEMTVVHFGYDLK